MQRISRTVLAAFAAFGFNAIVNAATPQADWRSYGNTYESQRFSPLSQITPANAADLKAVCQISLGDAGLFQSGMLVVGGTLYVTTGHTTVALDPATCKERWRHLYVPVDPEINPVNRGAAYLEGRLFRGTADGRLLALDARSGKELWKVKAADSHQGEFFSAAPIAWKGLVFIGPAGSDWGIRGWMAAFDAKTGKQVWHFNNVPKVGEPGAETWKDPESAIHGGGGTWTSYTLDPATGELFVPVANPGPDFAPDARPGDNLYTDSVVVLNATTGKLNWYYQLNANDGFDYDLGAPPMLYRDADGHRRVALGSKDGHVYVLDRESHHLLFRTPITTIVNPGRPTPEGVRACPGALGGVEWNGPAYSPDTRAIYVGSVDWCMVYKSGVEAFKPGGQLNYGTDISMPPGETRTGWITALDDRTGKINWQFHSPAPVVAGVTPTAGGVLFAGDLLGHFYAFDAHTGAVLQTQTFDSGIAGGIITYEAGGKQYVAVTVGNIGRLTFGGGGTPHVVIMTTGLPANYAAHTLAVVEPEAAAAAADPEHGQKLFGQFCVACHGARGEGVPGAGASVQNESAKKDHRQVVAWIKDPQPPMPKMYPAPLSDGDVEAVATYLETLK